MNGYKDRIEKLALENENFRKVLYTAKSSQLVLMSLKPLEEIGEEMHDVDQFFRIEKGNGKVIIDGNNYDVTDGDAIVVPAGSKHNVINSSPEEPMKLYTLYCPPHHRDGIVHRTKIEAKNDQEHFEGKTSE